MNSTLYDVTQQLRARLLEMSDEQVERMSYAIGRYVAVVCCGRECWWAMVEREQWRVLRGSRVAVAPCGTRYAAVAWWASAERMEEALCGTHLAGVLVCGHELTEAQRHTALVGVGCIDWSIPPSVLRDEGTLLKALQLATKQAAKGKEVVA